MIAAQGSPKKASSTRITRGRSALYACNCCLVEISGVYFYCPTCVNTTGLCFKCYGSKSTVHPQHDLKEDGYEWDSDDAASNASGSADDQDPDLGQDQQDFPDDFDDEIVGDDDGSIVADMEGSGTSAGEDTTVVSLIGTRPVGSLKTRIGAHR